jgi:pimeloyl-ACP methyl ester carboxylesterase
MSSTTRPHAATSGGFYSGGSGTPLVLLHGVGGTWRAWTPILPLLEGRHTVVALTLPGHPGGPPLPDGIAPSVAALVDGVAAELDRRGIDQAHLVGNSLGGWICLELARRGRARSVVVFGPAGAWRSRGRARALLGGMRLSFFLVRKLARRADSLVRRRWVRWLLLATQVHDPDHVPPEELAHSIRTSVDAGVVPALLRTIAHHSIEVLPENPACPVKVVWAEKDRIIPFAHFGAPLMDRLPGAELVRIPGIGHVPMWDAPSEVAREILEMTAACDVARHERPTGAPPGPSSAARFVS